MATPGRVLGSVPGTIMFAVLASGGMGQGCVELTSRGRARLTSIDLPLKLWTDDLLRRLFTLSSFLKLTNPNPRDLLLTGSYRMMTSSTSPKWPAHFCAQQ